MRYCLSVGFLELKTAASNKITTHPTKTTNMQQQLKTSREEAFRRVSRRSMGGKSSEKFIDNVEICVGNYQYFIDNCR